MKTLRKFTIFMFYLLMISYHYTYAVNNPWSETSNSNLKTIIQKISSGIVEVDRGYCWKDNYYNDNPRPLTTCPPGKEKIGALCFNPCPAGYRRLSGDITGRCYISCPEGSKDDGLTACNFNMGCSGFSYVNSNGATVKPFNAGVMPSCPKDSIIGRAPKAMKPECGNPFRACFYRWSCPSGLQKAGALCYKPCPAGMNMDGVGNCYATCPPGWSNHGLLCNKSQPCDTTYFKTGVKPTCLKKIVEGGDLGRTVLQCAPELELDGALCYDKCKVGFDRVAGFCWQKCSNSFFPANCAASCAINSSTCGSVIANQVLSPVLAVVTGVLTVITAGGAAPVAKSASAALGGAAKSATAVVRAASATSKLVKTGQAVMRTSSKLLVKVPLIGTKAATKVTAMAANVGQHTAKTLIKQVAVNLAIKAAVRGVSTGVNVGCQEAFVQTGDLDAQKAKYVCGVIGTVAGVGASAGAGSIAGVTGFSQDISSTGLAGIKNSLSLASIGVIAANGLKDIGLDAKRVSDCNSLVDARLNTNLKGLNESETITLRKCRSYANILNELNKRSLIKPESVLPDDQLTSVDMYLCKKSQETNAATNTMRAFSLPYKNNDPCGSTDDKAATDIELKLNLDIAIFETARGLSNQAAVKSLTNNLTTLIQQEKYETDPVNARKYAEALIDAVATIVADRWAKEEVKKIYEDPMFWASMVDPTGLLAIADAFMADKCESLSALPFKDVIGKGNLTVDSLNKYYTYKYGAQAINTALSSASFTPEVMFNNVNSLLSNSEVVQYINDIKDVVDDKNNKINQMQELNNKTTFELFIDNLKNIKELPVDFSWAKGNANEFVYNQLFLDYGLNIWYWKLVNNKPTLYVYVFKEQKEKTAAEFNQDGAISIPGPGNCTTSVVKSNGEIVQDCSMTLTTTRSDLGMSADASSGNKYLSLGVDCGTPIQRNWEKGVTHSKVGTKGAYEFCRVECDKDNTCNGFSLNNSQNTCYLKSIKDGNCVAPTNASTDWINTSTSSNSWIFYRKLVVVPAPVVTAPTTTPTGVQFVSTNVRSCAVAALEAKQVAIGYRPDSQAWIWNTHNSNGPFYGCKNSTLVNYNTDWRARDAANLDTTKSAPAVNCEMEITKVVGNSGWKAYRAESQSWVGNTLTNVYYGCINKIMVNYGNNSALRDKEHFGADSSASNTSETKYLKLNADCGTAAQRIWERGFTHNKKGTKEAYDVCKLECNKDATCSGFSLNNVNPICYLKSIKEGQCIPPVNASLEWDSKYNNWIYYSKSLSSTSAPAHVQPTIESVVSCASAASKLPAGSVFNYRADSAAWVWDVAGKFYGCKDGKLSNYGSSSTDRDKAFVGINSAKSTNCRAEILKTVGTGWRAYRVDSDSWVGNSVDNKIFYGCANGVLINYKNDAGIRDKEHFNQLKQTLSASSVNSCLMTVIQAKPYVSGYRPDSQSWIWNAGPNGPYWGCIDGLSINYGSDWQTRDLVHFKSNLTLGNMNCEVEILKAVGTGFKAYRSESQSWIGNGTNNTYYGCGNKVLINYGNNAALRDKEHPSSAKQTVAVTNVDSCAMTVMQAKPVFAGYRPDSQSWIWNIAGNGPYFGCRNGLSINYGSDAATRDLLHINPAKVITGMDCQTELAKAVGNGWKEYRAKSQSWVGNGPNNIYYGCANKALVNYGNNFGMRDKEHP